MLNPRIYLDHNATSPLRPVARQAMIAALDRFGNPSSIHQEGRAARKIVEDARQIVGSALNISPEQVFFTASGTEANNSILRGCGRRVIVSSIEHDSVLQPAQALGAAIIRVDDHGRLDRDHLAYLLQEDSAPTLVSVMLANNETGVLQDLPAIATIARDAGAWFHSDITQAIGKIPVAEAMAHCDLVSFSGHKMGGPKGVGGVVLRPGLGLRPFLLGGGQERRQRAGTENVAAIAGFGAALQEAASQQLEAERLTTLRNRLESGALAERPDGVVVGAGAPRLPNTTCLAVPGLTAETLLMGFDMAGLALSSGSACSSGKVTESHVLRAMGLSPALSRGALRMSLGWSTQDSDIDAFLAAWRSLARRADAA